MLDSSNDTVAILYDIENAPIEMLQYTIDIAQRYQPCRMIVVSDWEAHPDQKRWDRLMESPDFTFRQISRTFLGKNSLDSALYDSAQILYQEGARKYFIITTDSDFVRIAESLNAEDPSYIIGIGTKQASEDLRNAYNEFFVYPPPMEKEQKAARKKKEKKTEENVAKKKAAEEKTTKNNAKVNAETAGKAREQKKRTTAAAKKKDAAEHTAEAPTQKAPAPKETKKTTSKAKAAPAAKEATPKNEAGNAVMNGFLTVRLPKSLRASLDRKVLEEEVSLDELVTYLLMRGLSAK